MEKIKYRGIDRLDEGKRFERLRENPPSKQPVKFIGKDGREYSSQKDLEAANKAYWDRQKIQKDNFNN